MHCSQDAWIKSMSRYRRLYVPGGTYFFTVNLQNRGSDILVRHIDTIRAAYQSVSRKRPFETLAAVVLPDHLHCIWRLPEGDQDFSTRWRLIKDGVSKRLPARCAPYRPGTRRAKAVWQHRFWEHLVRDEEELGAYTDYIHSNPVKHGHASCVEAWPYSTWHRNRKLVTSPSGLSTGE